MAVSTSWDKLRETPDYRHTVGLAVYNKLFENDPELRSVFGLKKDQDFSKDEHFVRHIEHLMDMFDNAIDFLGPDLGPLHEDLIEQGKRHADYGVRATSLPTMGKSIVEVIKEHAGDHFTEKDQEAWDTVLRIFYHFMWQGMRMAAEAKTNHQLSDDEVVTSAQFYNDH